MLFKYLAEDKNTFSFFFLMAALHPSKKTELSA
jgi:hypothetical protein